MNDRKTQRLFQCSSIIYRKLGSSDNKRKSNIKARDAQDAADNASGNDKEDSAVSRDKAVRSRSRSRSRRGRRGGRKLKPDA